MKQLQHAFIALLLCGNAMAQSGQRQTIRLAQADIPSPVHVDKSELEKADALPPGEQRRAALRAALKSQRTSGIKEDGTAAPERRMTPEELAELRLELRKQRRGTTTGTTP
jgi:hypothetical protein